MGYIYKAFTITKDAELTVVDSNGSGRIWGDSYIRAADSQQTVNNNTVNIFDVENSSKLVISASGATIETGRSKEQYVNRAYINGNHNDRHTGNVRNQTNGSVVIARLGSSVVINAGKLIARGYPRFASNDVWATRCAAIDIYSGSHILINNGELRGYPRAISFPGIDDDTAASLAITTLPVCLITYIARMSVVMVSVYICSVYILLL